MNFLQDDQLYPAQRWQTRYATAVLRQGGVIAYPTETVWGLGCNPFDEAAVESILTIKQRPQAKGLILVAGQLELFNSLLVALSATQRDQIAVPREEPTSWLVPDHNNRIPRWVKGDHSGVVIRLSSHPQIAAITARLGIPLISTSANPAGRAPALSMAQARSYFHNRIDYYLPGQLGGYRKPSVIRSIESGDILRS